jgi:hypothetical protein
MQLELPLRFGEYSNDFIEVNNVNQLFNALEIY